MSFFVLRFGVSLNEYVDVIKTDKTSTYPYAQCYIKDGSKKNTYSIYVYVCERERLCVLF